MTNDELLSGYLDGSLSKDQLVEFEARCVSDPLFAAEATDMAKVEGLLLKKSNNSSAPIGFLSQVEESVVAKIVAGSAGALGLGQIFSNMWTWVVGTGVVLLGGSAAYVALNNSPAPSAAKVIPHKQVVAPAMQQKNIVAPSAGQPTVAEPVVQQRPSIHTQPARQPVTAAPIATSKSATAEANSPNSALIALEQDYAQCIVQHRSIQCAQIALQIADQYKLRSSIEKAREFYQAALTHARDARIVQYQVQALGALGMIARDSNLQAAQQYLSEAITLAKAAGLDYSEYAAALNSIR